MNNNSFQKFQKINLSREEILALPEQSDREDEFDDAEDIFIEPPAAGEEPDEDSADEDKGSGVK